MDHLTKAQRSRHMAKIRGDDLKPERLLAAALLSLGVCHDRNRKDLPGKPDLVIGNLAIFIHGCFWHGCRKHYRTPKTRSEHWDAHIWKNKSRDRRVRRKLRALGYRTKEVWEHDLKGAAAAAKAAVRIKNFIDKTTIR